MKQKGTASKYIAKLSHCEKNTDRFKLWGEHRITKEGFSPLIINVYPAGAVRLKGGAVYRWMANKSIWVQL